MVILSIIASAGGTLYHGWGRTLRAQHPCMGTGLWTGDVSSSAALITLRGLILNLHFCS